MKKWALIKNNLVDMITEQEEIPTAYTDDNSTWVEITSPYSENIYLASNWKYENGVFSPPDNVPITYSKLELINILENDYKNIITASKSDVDVEIWLEQFRLSENFMQTETNFIAGIDMLVSKNLISPEKANAILGRQ